jgi:hypothetical protein
MTVATYRPDLHYPIACQWWENHGQNPVPSHRIPKHGVMVSNDTINLFLTWAAMDNSTGLAFLLWPIGNPAAPPRQIHSATRIGIDFLTESLRIFGYHTLYTATHSHGLRRQLSKIGFHTDPIPTHHQFLIL